MARRRKGFGHHDLVSLVAREGEELTQDELDDFVGPALAPGRFQLR
jgi:hypothetical protein